MDEVLLVVTHLVAFGIGAATTWRVCTRRLRVTEHDGHLGLEVCHPDD